MTPLFLLNCFTTVYNKEWVLYIYNEFYTSFLGKKLLEKIPTQGNVICHVICKLPCGKPYLSGSKWNMNIQFLVHCVNLCHTELLVSASASASVHTFSRKSCTFDD